MTDESTPRPPDREPPPGVDDSVPQSARIWNYWLGGKDNYPIDREVADQFSELYPPIIDIARAQRYFLARAVRYLAGEAGIRQFLDIGTGLPTVDNTHEIAQRVAPEARIVYVDSDPLVLMHARALLTSRPEGVTDYVDADLRDTAAVLAGAAKTLDFSRPIAITMLGILGHIARYDEANSVVRRLLNAVPSGSHVVIADGTNLLGGTPYDEAMRIWNAAAKPRYLLRTPEEIAGFFDGLQLVEPGVVSVPLWRPDPSPFEPSGRVDNFGGVGKKP
ncbi:MAG TPA: SAM-dependent methyltransferase [Streptosporangiaceae bacterium]|nr:SAM-dependent methyltransferase [Streptosporangiaceae bacterium]